MALFVRKKARPEMLERLLQTNKLVLHRHLSAPVAEVLYIFKSS